MLHAALLYSAKFSETKLGQLLEKAGFLSLIKQVTNIYRELA